MEFKLVLVSIGLFILSRFMKKWRPGVAQTKWAKVYDETYEWIETGWSAVLLAAFLMYFFVQAFKITSGSMRMTLLEGDHLFVNKCVYGVHIPFTGGGRIFQANKVKRGDIIIFECPPQGLSQTERSAKVKKDFIKRCMAIGGDTVLIRNKNLFINGEPVDESYVNFDEPDMVHPPIPVFESSEQYQRAWESGGFANLPQNMVRDNFGPVIVPQGHYFAIGDNRDRSFDSRFWGPVPDKYLKGRALLLYWPLKRVRFIK